jgi:hypothetical protein
MKTAIENMIRSGDYDDDQMERMVEEMARKHAIRARKPSKHSVTKLRRLLKEAARLGARFVVITAGGRNVEGREFGPTTCLRVGDQSVEMYDAWCERTRTYHRCLLAFGNRWRVDRLDADTKQLLRQVASEQ